MLVDNSTLAEYRNSMRVLVERYREERGEAFDIEGALMNVKSRIIREIYGPVEEEYRPEIRAKHRADLSACSYCGKSLVLFPGTGQFCDICSDKFRDSDPYEDEGGEG